MSFTNSPSAYAFALGFMGLTLVPGVWTMANVPVSDLSTGMISGLTQRQYEARFDSKFPSRDAIGHAWAAIKFGALGEVSDGAVAGQDGVLFTAEEFSAPKEIHSFGHALTQARTQIQAAGAELVPVIVPDKARMMPDALPRARSQKFADRYDQLLDVIASQGLRTVDLRPALARKDAFMATDTHWSPEGARAVADEINTLLDGTLQTDTGYVTTQTGKRAFEGDLIAFADTGVWRAFVGPAPEAITTFETHAPADGGVGLFGEAATPVALVGTSFSAREDFHFVGFLKSALKSDVISFALEGRGPFYPMDQFLAADNLAANATQIVLWEIPERYLNTWSQDQ